MESKSQQGQSSATTPVAKRRRGYGLLENPDPFPASAQPSRTWKGRAGWVHAGRGVGGVQEKGMMSGGGWMDGNGGRVTRAGGQMDLFRDGRMYMDEQGW